MFLIKLGIRKKVWVLLGWGCFFFLKPHQPVLRTQKLAYFRSADTVG